MSANRPSRASMRGHVELLAWRYGMCGPASLVLLVLAAAMWFWGVRPLEQRLMATESQLRLPAPVRVRPATPASDDLKRLADFRRVLQPFQDHPSQVRRLVALTQDEFKWDQAEFSPSRDPAQDLVRVQITVPVVGPYRPLRQAVERALLDLPNLSVDQLSFKRPHAGQAVVEARVRMSLWLRSLPLERKAAP